MRTQLLGRVKIDETALHPELDRALSFSYQEPYGEFLCGRPWKSCMVWAPGGDPGDGVIAHYDSQRPSSKTPYGAQLPYLFEVLDGAFALDHLAFARLAVMSDSVLVPHRDYLEFDERSAASPAHRLHLPLQTNPHSLFSETDTVFRMAVGEIWSLDVTNLHSAAVLSEDKRVHLILDFRHAGSAGEVLRRPVDSNGIPAASISARPPLQERDRETLLGLSAVISPANMKDVFGLVIKMHYFKDGGEDFVWNTIMEIGRRSESRELETSIRDLHRYYALARAE